MASLVNSKLGVCEMCKRSEIHHGKLVVGLVGSCRGRSSLWMGHNKLGSNVLGLSTTRTTLKAVTTQVQVGKRALKLQERTHSQDMTVQLITKSNDLLKRSNFRIFKTFVRKMHADQDYCSEAAQYYSPVVPLERSKPMIPINELLEATKPTEAFPFDAETDMTVGGALADWVDRVLEKINSIFE